MKTGATQILGTLRRASGRMCSGKYLAQTLGVSRSQVWKYIESLRAHGYEIEGSAGDGYHLVSVPDRLFSEEISFGLNTEWLGNSIHHFDTVDSTNNVAHQLADENADHGTIVIAEGQTSGRGRHGRPFHSPPYLNLYLSVILRPSLAIAACPTVIFASAIAVAETIKNTAGSSGSIEIKWPNDVLLGGLKTSGILMELVSEATRVKHLILGIGVNLNVQQEDFPSLFRRNATSVRSVLGRTVDRIDFTQRLIRHLEFSIDKHAAGGFSSIRKSFNEYFHMPGKFAQITDLNGAPQEGTVIGVTNVGALKLRSKSGKIFEVIAGDVNTNPKGLRKRN